MYRFISTLDNDELCKRYLKLFKRPSLNKRFKELLIKHPGVADTIPLNYRKAEDLLNAPFDILVTIYFNFVNYVDSLGKAERVQICEDIKEVLDYEGRSTRIGNFLCDPANGFSIHNCVYCDIKDIEGYRDTSTNKVVRAFKTEHILDKGRCPLVSLSLFNFAPSCDICNSANHKGVNPLGRTKEEMILLSPTSDQYKLAEEVKFTVEIVNPNLEDLMMFKNEHDLEINFKGNVVKYERSICLFKLKDRYNAKKLDIFEVLEKGRKYQNILNSSNPDDIALLDDILNFKRRKERHEPMEKCRRDIFEEHFGKIPE